MMVGGISCNIPVLTANQMLMADRHTIEVDGISSSELMERAGQAVVDMVKRCAPDGGRIVIVVGPGHNGGDGFVAARLLRNKRVPVTVIPLLPLEALDGEVARQAQLAKQAGVKVRPATCDDDLESFEGWLKRSVMIVDAIFGVGLSRPITGWMAKAVACMNRCDRQILAVDMPSGIDTDTGRELGVAVRADFTLPIAAYKWGHWLAEGREYAGKLLPPASIGITESAMNAVMQAHPSASASGCLINEDIIGRAFPERNRDAHKKCFGHLWIFGGSHGYTGAPRLAAYGAQAVGVGLVSIACPDDVYAVVAASSREVMVHCQNDAPWQQANAVVAGPGWGREYASLLLDLLSAAMPLVLDADALNMMAGDGKIEKKLGQRSALTVMTPHPGEAARLLGVCASDIQHDRLQAALKLVEKYACWTVLKGAQTLIVSPKREVWVCPFGSPRLAVAGTGDVLAGMIGGLLAAGRSPEVAVPAAIGLHAMAGEGDGWYRAGQLGDKVAELVGSLRSC